MMAQRASHKQSRPWPTAGEVFPNGAMLELLRDPSDSGRLALVHWERKRFRIAREFTIAGLRYAPVEVAGPLSRLRLPSEPKPYGSTVQLFNEVNGLLARYSELTESDLSLLTHFVFASFFSDCTRIAPCLLLSGSRAEAIALLRMLRWVCRLAILLTDGGLYDFPGGLKPTRLICQAGAKIEKLLAPLQLSGFGISRNGSVREICSATAIYTCEGELQSSFADGCLRISIAPSRRLLSVSDEQREEATIAALQNTLLDYRIENFAKVRGSDFDIPEFSGSTRELARSLAACVVDAPELQEQLVALLQPHDEALRSERTPNIAGTLLEVLLMFCHERRKSAYVSEVADDANKLFARRKDILTVSARETGGRLKSLGFHTVRLDAGGRGLRFGQADCNRIHHLARRYEVPALGKGLPGCPHCKQIRSG
jgi:hypothetical protein